jgi:curved DNA-binding protein CbpA
MDEDYYTILELTKDCKKIDIKKKFRKLSLKYHPDKNGDNEKFLKIKEAYDVLYDDEKRKVYDIQLFFKDIELGEEDYELLFSYYNKFIQSNEYKLMMLLYNSIPKKVKEDIFRKFKYRNSNIVKAEKSIDITSLYTDEFINLVIKNEEYQNNELKIIYIFTNYGTYYLYLRNFPKVLVLDNMYNTFTIHFFIV